MGKRQRDWAKRARLALIQQLGGKCVDCDAIKDLELDHIEPCTWDLCSVDQSWRTSKYRQEAKEGKLAVRCRRCNAQKQDHTGVNGRMPEIEPSEVPF